MALKLAEAVVEIKVPKAAFKAQMRGIRRIAIRTATRIGIGMGRMLIKGIGKAIGGVARMMAVTVRGIARTVSRVVGGVLGIVRKAAKRIILWIKRISLAVAGLLVVISRMTMQFGYRMGEIRTLLVDLNDKGFKPLIDGAQRLSRTLGKSLRDITDGMYEVISATVPAAEAVGFLEVTSKAAATGIATTLAAVKLGTAVIKGYGAQWNKIDRVMDLAFQTVRLGQTRFGDLADSMGRLIPVFAAAGGTVEELFAAFATLTGVTGDAWLVTTQLRGLMNSFLRPTKDSAKFMKQLGLEWGTAAIKAKGLGGVMRELWAVTQGNAESIARVIPNVRALPAAMALGGQQASVFVTKLDAMRKAGGTMRRSFERIAETVQFKWNRMWRTLIGVAVNFGRQLTPLLGRAFDGIRRFLSDNEGAIVAWGKTLADWAERAYNKVKGWVEKIHTSISTNWDKIKAVLSGARDWVEINIMSKIRAVVRFLIENQMPILNVIKSIAVGAATALGRTFDLLANGLRNMRIEIVQVRVALLEVMATLERWGNKAAQTGRKAKDAWMFIRAVAGASMAGVPTAESLQLHGAAVSGQLDKFPRGGDRQSGVIQMGMFPGTGDLDKATKKYYGQYLRGVASLFDPRAIVRRTKPLFGHAGPRDPRPRTDFDRFMGGGQSTLPTGATRGKFDSFFGGTQRTLPKGAVHGGVGTSTVWVNALEAAKADLAKVQSGKPLTLGPIAEPITQAFERIFTLIDEEKAKAIAASQARIAARQREIRKTVSMLEWMNRRTSGAAAPDPSGMPPPGFARAVWLRQQATRERRARFGSRRRDITPAFRTSRERPTPPRNIPLGFARAVWLRQAAKRRRAAERGMPDLSSGFGRAAARLRGRRSRSVRQMVSEPFAAPLGTSVAPTSTKTEHEKKNESLLGSLLTEMKSLNDRASGLGPVYGP